MSDDPTRLLREMIRIRAAEETIADLYAEQEMRTPMHLSIGQEAVAVGVMAALRPDDVVYSGHRCHAEYLAKGGSLLGLIAELYGRVDGCCKGRGGSVHLNAPEVGHLGSSAILGETVATAVGSAWAYKMDKLDRVAVCFFGDAVVEEGVWHESVNFAVVHQLPVLFVCVNNGYSTHTPLQVRQPAGVTPAYRAFHAGIDYARSVDGNNVQEVASTARELVGASRRGLGPTFLEAITYRWREHVGPNWDHAKGYRTQAEVDEWMTRCPIKREAERLIAAGQCTVDLVGSWRANAETDAQRVAAQAKVSPFPDVADLLVGVV